MKTKLKRTISTALACVLLLALLPASALAASWADQYVQAAQTNGWVDSSANADAKLTRGQFAVILWKALGSPAATTDSPFEDVTDPGELKAAVTTLAAAGVIEGDGTTFDPDSTLTREAGIAMLARGYGLEAQDANAAAGYADWADVSDWAQSAIAAAVEAGIVNGVGGNKLAPQGDITLGEMAKLVVTADLATPSAIVSVTAEGNVDTDGAKTERIVVEYDRDMTGANVSVDTYQIFDYGISQGDSACEIGSDPGVATSVTAQGNYVYIDVNADYQLGSVAKKYAAAMAVSVKQVADITVGDATIPAGVKTINNYTYQVTEDVRPNGEVSYNEFYLAKDNTYTLANIAGYKTFSGATAFHATNCFEEATGEYVDVDLPYALYVPEDYDASKEYALVLQVEDAGFLGDDPMITLTEAQACANFASDEVQQIVKDQHGLAGIIVVSPQISEELRSTRDNWSLSAAVPATWQLLDYLTETYNINTDYIYGTGQSMGGMQVVAMAAQRDNYFAGIWANGCQWGTNYDLEDGYEGSTYYEAPVDGVYITGKDADGNDVDYRNWYYMISDDNVLITNCAGDKFSTQTWKELDFLYHDLAGTDLIYDNYKAIWNPLTTSTEDQNAAAEAVMAKAAAESDRGFVWTSFEGGNHMATWIYSHGVFAHYEWLLSQTQDTIKARGKLECLKNNFEYADEQDTSEARELAPDADGNMVYYATGKAGAGTADYNGCWLKMGNSVLKAPNWKVEAAETAEAGE
jgi:predicted peptidase